MFSAPRKRAAGVCQNCHRRKIKCEFHYAGSPCMKCSESNEICEPRTRKSYAPRKTKKVARQLVDEPQSLRGESRDRSASAVDHSESATDSDDGDQVVANAVKASEVLVPNAETVPLFVGDEQGIGALLQAAKPDTANNNRRRHFMIPRIAAKVLQAEDLEYLKVKGCFSLPSADVCSALIESYFHFVHPLFPVIDAHEFLGRYAKYGVQQINLLLLWSMFSVSAGYIQDHVLESAGFITRKAFKENIVQRAKLLYDLSSENDKIVLIEAALLLSFWFVDAEDVKQSWYWTGIAISISQTIGLHRDPDAKRRNSALSDQQRRSWRNIWWSCLFRDSWLAFGMGRPVRINPKDCDCPMPTLQDAELNFKEVIINGRDIYAPEVATFASLWLDLLGVSAGLHKLLSIRYRSHLGQPSVSQIDALRTELAPRLQVTETFTTDNVGLTVAVRQLHLHRRAAQIALFRPDADSHATEKVQEAAGAINTLLESSMADGTAVYAAPTTIPLIVPAMFTHLMAVRSKVLLTSQLGAHKLDLCLLFLKTLENNYPAAGIVHRLFLAANNRKGKPSDEAVFTAGILQQPSHHHSPNPAGFADTDARSQQSSIGFSPSSFALLPMQRPLSDMTIDETDEYVLPPKYPPICYP
ncbi:MAG: hypothetical protein M1818_002501 [Claussenomyces sp. TS43310]|nr:MAG: hypothetical protein M1818_002501 [Claussenomyces sp. TS43310]